MSVKPSSTRTSTKEAPRAWQRMLSGRRLDLLDPSPLDVEIEDIAHGLARVALAVNPQVICLGGFLRYGS